MIMLALHSQLLETNMVKEQKKYQKVYVVFFQYSKSSSPRSYGKVILETIFSERKLASKYVRIERIKRDLQAGELWYEQRSVIDNSFEL